MENTTLATIIGSLGKCWEWCDDRVSDLSRSCARGNKFHCRSRRLTADWASREANPGIKCFVQSLFMLCLLAHAQPPSEKPPHPYPTLQSANHDFGLYPIEHAGAADRIYVDQWPKPKVGKRQKDDS